MLNKNTFRKFKFMILSNIELRIIVFLICLISTLYACSTTSSTYCKIDDSNIDFMHLKTNLIKLVNKMPKKMEATTDTNMIFKTRVELFDTYGVPEEAMEKRFEDNNIESIESIVSVDNGRYTDLYYCLWEEGNFKREAYLANINKSWTCIYLVKYRITK